MYKVLHLLRWDVDMQIRGNVYAATAFSTAVLCGVAVLLPFDPLPTEAAAFLVFADPAAVGLAFVGAVIFLEKAANTLSAVSVMPMPGWMYVLSKVISLTFLGVISGVAVAWFASDGAFDTFYMMTALVLSNAVAVLIGFALVARAKSMNEFLVRVIIAITIGYLPLLAFFSVIGGPIDTAMRLIPSYPMLILLEAGIDPDVVSEADKVFSIAYLCAWIIVGWLWSLREYQASILTQGR